MNYNDAEKVRSMIAGHWRLQMDDATCDLWLGALLPKDAKVAVDAVARLAKTTQYPPKIADLEEVYTMMVGNAALPPAESCPTCAGDQFVFMGMRPPVRTQWMEDHGIELPKDGGMMEEYAPCPDCNSDCNTSFYRHDGSVVASPDPALVRERMAPSVQRPVPKGAQTLPGDVKTYLRDMQGTSTEFEEADPGSCEQCGHEGKRFEYGKFKLCDRCSSLRQKVAERISVEDVVELLHDTQ